MKTVFSIVKKGIAGAFLLAVMYFIVTDAMMTIFDLSRGIQYAFNMGAVFCLCPLGIYFLLGLEEESK